MEDQLHRANVKDHLIRQDKEISITNLVREERKIIEDRFNEELDRLRQEKNLRV